MLGRGRFACGKILVYHLSEKINSSLFEFLPKFLRIERERERERETMKEKRGFVTISVIIIYHL